MDYKVTELPNVLHIPHQLVRFGVPIVPVMRFGRQNVPGSTAIMHRLDELAPDPPLYPDPRVEAAEQWIVDELQPIARRAAPYAAVNHNASSHTFFEQSRLPMPAPVIRAITPVVGRLGMVRQRSGEQAVTADLRALPALLERLDGLVDDGVIGGDTPNAADLQVGSNLGLLLGLADLEPVIRAQPRVAAIADRWFPDYPGRVPAGVLPAV
jgi:glutathione S-transferase